MEHEHGAFKVNRPISVGAVKKAPETAPFLRELARRDTLRCRNFTAGKLDIVELLLTN
jgi:hypothetical protein